MPRIGVVSALKDEAERFSQSLRFEDQRHREIFQIVQTGIGNERITAALENSLNVPTDALIVFGTAAGIEPALVAGDLVIYDSVAREDETHFATSKNLNQYLLDALATLNPHCGIGLSVTKAVCSVNEKQQIRSTESCLCIDMESATIANWALQRHIPVACVRAIVDAAGQAVPSAALKGMRPDGKTSALATGLALIKNPGQFPDLVRLARQYQKALNKLSAAAKLIVSNLNARNLKEFGRHQPRH